MTQFPRFSVHDCHSREHCNQEPVGPFSAVRPPQCCRLSDLMHVGPDIHNEHICCLLSSWLAQHSRELDDGTVVDPIFPLGLS